MTEIVEELPRLAPIMKKLLQEHILVGPTLTHVSVATITSHHQQLIHQEARRLVRQYWPEHWFARPAIQPYYQKVVATNAMIDAITSTAAFYAHLRLGQSGLEGSMILVASKLLETSMKRYSPETVFALAFLVNAYDDYQAIQYYQPMLVTDFVSGQYHRPWASYPLEEECKLILDYGVAEWVSSSDRLSIRLTKKGEDHLKEFQAFLQETGFLEKRAALNRFAGFGQMEDYDEIMNRLSNAKELRAALLKNARLQPNMHVLELGCGTGMLTLDAGLYKKVGLFGQITAIDPSLGMLNRAMKKPYSGASVKFLQATAEELPFESNTFDAAVGFLFLHFTDIPQALREIHRVCKPGAWLTTIYGLQFPQTEPFLEEWLAPIFQQSRSMSKDSVDRMPKEDTIRNILSTLECTYEEVTLEPVEILGKTYEIDQIIRFWFQAGNFFEPFMRNLPWKAQQDLIQQLTERGYRIREKYGEEGMIQHHPGQFLQARVIKSTC
ncbi:methyltransferase domain-containing protein [Alicyclobacillus sp. TC]|uniref:Ubiquinone/menaquinone biosynthesis C-methylase UbiE n=2 Tax=Alicyclobacillus tolerans TaxID=90970 RepID=A0A1M6WJM5_9BACL|nr:MULTISPECIES: methyltransferase domain-containing protein [Alicyclobacillus]MDP9728289.1 ubiquinone/menaquinone biosynthesis C-methylase UbiE [Alicyclobacillus tengchongensis]QRF23493.1 methyltransferase domain-containing protein [Alicyclobacillus sp. TC]SHK93927.1 Ubiquinone/menaquinone biosynthesis C-methylase UbiE [Alicyclobacillus montanus]